MSQGPNFTAPLAPDAYDKLFADQLIAAIRNAFGKTVASRSNVVLPKGAVLTLTDSTGKLWDVSVSTLGALVVTAH